MADDSGLERDPVERRAIDADAALVRGVRWRLVAWSALTTFLVLLVLGVALYAIVERSLAAAGTAQLEARADDIHTAIARGGPGRAALGQIFGGRASGTIAMLVDEDGRSVLRGAPALLEGLPERNAIAAVADGPAGDAARDIRTGTIEGTAGAVPFPHSRSGNRIENARYFAVLSSMYFTTWPTVWSFSASSSGTSTLNSSSKAIRSSRSKKAISGSTIQNSAR